MSSEVKSEAFRDLVLMRFTFIYYLSVHTQPYYVSILSEYLIASFGMYLLFQFKIWYKCKIEKKLILFFQTL